MLTVDDQPMETRRRLLHRAPVLWRAVLLLVTLELVFALIAPHFILDHQYLQWYLDDTAIANTKALILDNHPYVMWDTLVGWRGRPNSGKGKWWIDGRGARGARGAPENQSTGLKPKRILFLGNSLTNGGMDVRYDQTISAMLEDSIYECLNFATMLYSVDQMVLDYQDRLRKFDPHVLVVGISSDPYDGLGSRYIPFWNKQENLLPFFKPRFELDHERLVLVPPPHRDRIADMLNTPGLLESLKQSDEYYSRFSSFKRFGLLPLSGSLRGIFTRLSNLKALLMPDRSAKLKLLLAMLEQLRNVTRDEDVSLVIMLLPNQAQAFPTSWRTILPDQHAHLDSALSAEGYTVLDGRAVLRDSGAEPWQLFSEDRQHYTATGNRLIASHLQKLTKVTPK